VKYIGIRSSPSPNSCPVNGVGIPEGSSSKGRNNLARLIYHRPKLAVFGVHKFFADHAVYQFDKRIVESVLVQKNDGLQVLAQSF
jgi:hypothetical protein